MNKTRLHGLFGRNVVYAQVSDIQKRPADLSLGASSVAAGSVMPAALDLFQG